MKRLFIVVFLFTLMVAGLGLDMPKTAYAVPTKITSQADCNAWRNYKFLGFIPVWYEYLPVKYVSGNGVVPATCAINVNQNTKVKGTITPNHQYWLVGLAVIDILLHIAGFLAVIFVIVGATRYIVSQGQPESIRSAQKTIMNALIGLVIALIASPTISFIASTFK